MAAPQCSGCLDLFHLECLEKPLDKKPERWASWRCLACKACEVCQQDGSKTRLAVCDICDNGFHIGCLEQPLKAFPLRGFKCPSCVHCSSCGTTEFAKGWNTDYTMCTPCSRSFKQKK